MSRRHDETFFSWFKNLISKCFSLLVCFIAAMVFLNSGNVVVMFVAGSVALCSFGSLFADR